MCNLVLLRLLKSAPEPQLFSNIKPYRNRNFVLSIDGFGFSISERRHSSILTVLWTLNSMLRQNDRGALTRRACFFGCQRSRPDQTEISCGAAFSVW